MPYRSFCRILTKTAMLVVMLFLFAGQPGMADEMDAGQLLRGAVRRFEAVQSYTCRLDKRVAKSGTLYEDLSISVKYKKPAHYYFRWDLGPRAGREVIFAAGKHSGKIIAHPGGWFKFMTFRLSPEGRLAMKENRHSLRHSGLEKIMHVVEADYHRSEKEGFDAIHYIGEDRVDDNRVWVLQGKFPKNRGYYAERVVLFLDQTLLLPIKVSIYDGEDTLLEEYVFHRLAINVGLTDRDFDPGNPDYNF